MKRSLTALLALVLALSLLVGCGTKEADRDDDSGREKKPEAAPMETEPVVEADSLADKDLQYVLIYNPGIYDEKSRSHNDSLTTGYLGTQVDVDGDRGDELEEEPVYPFSSVSQEEVDELLGAQDLVPEGDRAGVLVPEYTLNQTREFYAFSSTALEVRQQYTFTCSYVGEHCYIWAYDADMSENQVQAYGEAFDNTIYGQLTDMFGESRFCADGGKVHILFYPLPTNIGGVFTSVDGFATGEYNTATAQYYGMNFDHDIININALHASNDKNKTAIMGTMAHEFQHLICFTSNYESFGQIRTGTWLNESMSNYIDEYMYPGTKQNMGHLRSFRKSDLLRYGQSLYNFYSEGSDIGVYGSVYYFAEYLANEAGDEVFANIHSYWRNSYSSTLCDAEALYNAVPESFREQISGSIVYPAGLKFDSDEEEWLSKLTLNFYLDMLSLDTGDPESFESIKPEKLLYDEINEVTIEGGGRIIIAVKNGKFEIPEDADNGLIYVGLNKDFEVITDFVSH